METDAKLVSDNEEEPEKKGWDEKTVKKTTQFIAQKKKKTKLSKTENEKNCIEKNYNVKRTKIMI